MCSTVCVHNNQWNNIINTDIIDNNNQINRFKAPTIWYKDQKYFLIPKLKIDNGFINIV